MVPWCCATLLCRSYYRYVYAGKKITMIFPPLEKPDEVKELNVTISDNKDWKEFVRDEHGRVEKDGKNVRRYEDLEDGSVYVMGGDWRDSIMNDRAHRQTEAKVLEVESGASVQRHLGGSAHRHLNVIFEDGNNNRVMEVDSVVVHVGGRDVANSAAYVVESAQSPKPREVDVLLKKVEKFKELPPTHVHFKSCSTFVPVLAGRNWPAETLSLCRSKGVWTVSPSGGGYTVSRAMSTLLRRFK